MDTKLSALLIERDKIEAKIVQQREMIKTSLKDQIDNLLEPHGFQITDLYNVRGKRTKPKVTTAAGLYRDPNNESNTWEGRGRKPAWLNEYVKSGAKVEDFKVNDAA